MVNNIKEEIKAMVEESTDIELLDFIFQLMLKARSDADDIART